LCVLVAYGTRPEVIKLAPVVRRLHAVPDLHVVVAASGQHRELAAAAARELGVEPDHDLAVPRPDPGLNSLFARLLTAFDELLEEVQPDWLLVQGDTSTACAAALAAFHRRVRIGHVEAGLRTGDLAHPFPEEANRRWIDAVSDELFAPTAAAAAALVAEGAASQRIHLTGNTAIDTLLSWPVTETVPPVREDRVLVTVHRR